MTTSEVSLDYFPAVVETPGGTFSRVRVVIAAGRALVFESVGHGPALVSHVAAPEPHIDQTRGMPWRVQTAEGEWRVNRADGCGCGNVLRALDRTYLLGLAGVA